MGSIRMVMLVLAAAVLFFGMPAADAARALRSINVPAIFVFGDSLADVGTNNYLPNATYRADFPPYGETFFEQPTGRFSDGRLIVDFLAEALKLPFAPPFLQPNASFNRGVNFASAGSGLLNSTSEGFVNPMSLQVQQFGAAKSILQQEMGVESTNELISKSIFFIVSGTNDLSAYLTNETLRREFSDSTTEYIAFTISNYKKALVALHDGGARKVVVVELSPFECVPLARIQLHFPRGSCVKESNELAQAFNAALKQLVDGLRNDTMYSNLNIVFAFTYDTVLAIIKDGASFNLTNVNSACCGAGYLKAEVQCGKRKPPLKPYLCDFPDKSLFWDSVHPTEVVVHRLFNWMYIGNVTYADPINVKALADL